MGDSISLQSTDSQTSETSANTESDEQRIISDQKQEHVAWSLILALAVCYHSCLKRRKQYREKLQPQLQVICPSIKHERHVLNIITRYKISSRKHNKSFILKKVFEIGAI